MTDPNPNTPVAQTDAPTGEPALSSDDLRRAERLLQLIAQGADTAAQQRAAQQYQPHTPPSIAEIGGILVSAGIDPDKVGPLIAGVQRVFVTGMVEVISMLVGAINEASNQRMAGLAQLVRSMPRAGILGGHHQALVQLLLTDPIQVDRTLLAAQYDGNTDWRDAIPRR
jgi:hypothetical protein